MHSHYCWLWVIEYYVQNFDTDLEITFILSAGNPEPNITWTKDGAAPYRLLGNVRYGRWSLILEDSVVSDSGNYIWIVCNLCGCINFSFKVDIVGMFIYRMLLSI
jgi:hypothetical protein